MGSLVPGWNTTAPGVPPKDLRDYDDHAAQPRESYFEKLAKSKSSKHDNAPVSDQKSQAGLGRPSPVTAGAPAGAGSLQRAFTLPTAASGRLSISISPSQQRGSAASPMASSPRTPKSPLSRKSAPLTGAELRRQEESMKDPIHKPFRWWRKFSSARLNELPDTADPNNWRRSPYVPQYGVTGQKMQYIGTQTASSSEAAGEGKGVDSPKAPDTPPAASNAAHKPPSGFISVH